MRIERQNGPVLVACLAYDAAPVAAPQTSVGSYTGRFTLLAANDGSWRVVQMGGLGSCDLG